MFKFAAAVAAVSLCMAGVAQAQSPSPVVNHFARMCADNAGNADKALALAGEAGWVALPPGAFEGADMPFTNLRVRMSSEGDVILMLLVGDMEQEVEGMNMKMKACGLVAQHSEQDGVINPDPEAALGAWVGMKPHPTFQEPDMTGYAFTIEDGQRRSLEGRSDLALAEAALSGKMNMIMVGNMDGANILFYAVPTF